MNPILTLIISLLLATSAHGGVLTGAAKLFGKIVGHGADNAVVHVAAHYGDDAAKAVAHYGDDAAKAATHHGDDAARMAARGGETAATHLTPQVVRTVDAAVDAARVEARAAQPAVETIHRTPIVRPMHLAASGAAVGTVVAAEVAIEAACIKTTVGAVQNLALRFGGKAIGKGAAFAIAPAADGPFPFGDVIAVFGAAWTAYDVYDLVDVLPGEIEKSLKGTVQNLQMQTLEAVSDAVRQTRDAHEQAARSLAAAAWTEQDTLRVAAF